MSFEHKLQQIVQRHEQLTHELQSPDLKSDQMVKLAKEYSELEQIVGIINARQKATSDLAAAKIMLSEVAGDAEMVQLAQAEIDELQEKLPQLEQEMKLALIPKDQADTRNAILELRAGTGGDEAAIFAGDLFAMYQRYAQSRRWQFEILEMAESDQGGYKEIVASISGDNVFGRLKFESGVHRVQRVPKTETQGRIHTSAATVAVLPEAEDVDIVVEEKDLKIDTFRASGAGGQHVNTTDSAVRITHLPTGVVVACQAERSQHKNKAAAMKMLRTKIYDEQRLQLDKERAADRKSQVGSGDRSERIRTYNYPQSRVTDHRINLTLYNLDQIIAGDALDQLIDPLHTADQLDKLANL
ncbi:MAG TPA: peptide chain release factor 1 [Alphaproteobacteria bacterium]